MNKREALLRIVLVAAGQHHSKAATGDPKHRTVPPSRRQAAWQDFSETAHHPSKAGILFEALDSRTRMESRCGHATCRPMHE